jgi:hypothetical protein
MVQAGGHQQPRIPPEALNLDRSLRRRGRVLVERRDETSGTWIPIASFGTEAAASERIDEEVALGHGSPEDYVIRPVGGGGWTRLLMWAAVVAIAASAGLVVLVMLGR